jgi:hypothetical protein
VGGWKLKRKGTRRRCHPYPVTSVLSAIVGILGLVAIPSVEWIMVMANDVLTLIAFTKRVKPLNVIMIVVMS